MTDFLILLSCSFIILGAFITLSDLFNGELFKRREPEPQPEPFTTRALTAEEIDALVRQIVVLDKSHLITPQPHDLTHHRVSDLVSYDLGRRFELDGPSWFNVARAWFATERLPLDVRREVLTRRLTHNI